MSLVSRRDPSITFNVSLSWFITFSSQTWKFPKTKHKFHRRLLADADLQELCIISSCFRRRLSPSHVIHVIIIACSFLITAITFPANIVGSSELGWLDPELVIGPRRSMKCVRNGTNGNIVRVKRLLKHFSSALLSQPAFSPTARRKVRVGRLNRIDCYNRSDGVK